MITGPQRPIPDSHGWPGRAGRVAQAPRVGFGGEAMARLGTRSVNGLLSVFNQIDSSYLVGFLAMDVVGLWIERIFTGLLAGRYHYDPQADPANRQRSPLQRRVTAARETLKGLNWPNMWEELKREALTAPGCMGLPTLAFIWARWHHGSQALQLGYDSLRRLSDTFAAAFSQAPEALSSQAMTTRFADTVNGLFVDTAMRAKPLEASLAPLAKAYGLTTEGTATIGDFIDHWAQRWAQQAIAPRPDSPKNTRKVLEDLAEDLHQVIVEEYNRVHGDQAHALSRDQTLVRLHQALPGPFGGTEAVTRPQNLKALLKDLTLYQGILHQAAQRWLAQPQEMPFATVLRTMQRTLTRQKFVLALAATALGSVWLLMLPNFVQKSKSYPATRLYQPAAMPEPPVPATALRPSAVSAVSSVSTPQTPGLRSGPAPVPVSPWQTPILTSPWSGNSPWPINQPWGSWPSPTPWAVGGPPAPNWRGPGG